MKRYGRVRLILYAAVAIAAAIALARRYSSPSESMTQVQFAEPDPVIVSSPTECFDVFAAIKGAKTFRGSLVCYRHSDAAPAKKEEYLLDAQDRARVLAALGDSRHWLPWELCLCEPSRVIELHGEPGGDLSIWIGSEKHPSKVYVAGRKPHIAAWIDPSRNAELCASADAVENRANLAGRVRPERGGAVNTTGVEQAPASPEAPQGRPGSSGGPETKL